MKERKKGWRWSNEAKKRISIIRKNSQKLREHLNRISILGNNKWRGQHHSDETKKKIGKGHIGNKNLLGKKHTDITKQKISEARKKNNPGGFKKGRKLSEEQKQMLIKLHTGKKRTDETRKRLSEAIKRAKKGKKPWNWKDGLSNTSEYHKAKSSERRARKAGNGGSHTFGEWDTLKAQYNWTCPCCKKREPEIKLTKDHIIPIIKGGSDNIENIQPLCWPCNNKKKTKIIKYNN